MRLLSLTLLALAAAAASAAQARAQTAEPRAIAVRLGGAGHKVTAPVEVEMVALPDPAPGRRRVRITARPSVDAPSLSLTVSAESGWSLAPGTNASWTGAAEAGREIVREVELVVTGPGELRLVVEAAIRTGSDFAQRGIHEFALNPTAADRSAALPKSFPAPPTDPGGRTVLEIPAATP
jgi:hypothetical protein